MFHFVLGEFIKLSWLMHDHRHMKQVFALTRLNVKLYFHILLLAYSYVAKSCCKDMRYRLDGIPAVHT